jgi:lactoylglutathione lyase
VEIVSRHKESTVTNKYTFAQTMIRIKDPVKSLEFYRDILGMTLVRETTLGAGTDWAFSLYFLAHMPAEEAARLPPPDSGEAGEAIRHMFRPMLELTHNHGTENDASFK